ncbi:MAG: hypothetical protein ACTTI8_03585 [Prevotella intermedia]|uniref:hypothetical protein n=1 Tax=Prevotella intermedia TaxID=28131 RepID=UPI00211ED38F|nr:hypothetical protein [Prevotella intermedia]
MAILIPKEQVATSTQESVAPQSVGIQNGNDTLSYENEAATQPKTKRKRGRGLVKAVLLLLFGALLIGGVFSFNRYRQQQEELVKIARQHHRDSVMKVREMLQAKAIAAQKQEKMRTMAYTFLRSFYLNAVLSGADVTQYEPYLTEGCRQILYGINENASGLDKQAAWWGMFGTLSGLDNADELSRNLRISHYEGDWYKVRLAQNGESEQRLVKLKQVGNRFLIDNVR